MSPQAVIANTCAFPKLLETEAEKAERSSSLEIELSSLNALEDIVENSPAHFSRILRACWGLVLRCYTGLDTVSFLYEDETDLNGPGLRAFAMDIHVSGSCADMLNQEEVAVAVDLKDAWKNVNSAMLIRKVTGDGEVQKPTRTTVSPECYLRIHVKLLKGSFRIFLDHWTGAISSNYGRSIASTFDTVMSQILLHPDLRIEGIYHLSAHDKAQIMRWNGSARERVDRTIHETIMDQVARRPDAEAVHAWDGSMTFASLDRASSTLALRLRDMGVGPEVFVPLAFSKSKWNIVAMIGVLKAGGAFIPLDPTHPISRLKSLAQAVNANVMLCSREHADALASVTETVLPLDEQMLSEVMNYGKPELTSVSPDNAAYIIFTSGSTGMPKGTVIEHASFCSGARYHAPALHLSSTQNLRALAFSSHSFDASLIDMLTVLMVGGCICIPDEENRLNNLAGVINDMRVNWATLTPTVVRFLEPAMVPTLETIVLAGEAMSQSNLDTWSRINLVNAYGPSECSVAACINSHVRADSDPKDIGFPVGIRAWVVDPENYNKLLPVGCVGELLAEGPTLARCYLNDGEKTNQVFIHDPEWAVDAHGNRQKLRGYLTGDLVRQYPDGSLSFIGRKDTQIVGLLACYDLKRYPKTKALLLICQSSANRKQKYHGQRIELGEIENSILRESSIKHVLVMLPKSGHFQGRLVATVSLAGFKVSSTAAKPALLSGSDKHAADAIIAKVRDALESQIPAYMIPSTWVIVEDIPQLVSGKLDRKVMSNWLANLDERSCQIINPISDAVETVALTDAEQKIRKITCHVLNLRESQVSLDRSFLGMGGDSISAMQMMSICQKDGIGITVQVILKSKSLRQLAASIQGVKVHSYEKEKIGEHFDLSPIQRLWFRLPNQGKGHFNQSFFLQVTRPVSESNAQRAIESIIERHPMLRARFDDIGYGVWQQKVTNDISGSYRFRRHNINEKEDATAAVAECQQSLNPFKGPLFGVELFNLNDGRQLMFAVGHHLVIDLVSWRTILQDLEDLLEDPQARLLPTTMPFSTWCRLQAEQAPTLRLNEVLPHTKIPTGNFAYWNIPDTENTYGNATSEGFELDSAVTSQFLSVVQDNMKVDPIDALLATLIYSWSKVFKDREIPPVYNEGHGREPWNSSIDLSRTVGWFTTVFPIQVAMSESDDMLDVIKRVNEYRKQVPDNGRPYFARRCLTSVGQEFFGTHTRWEMSFNYLGQYQQLEREGALLRSVDNLAGEARGAGGIADVGFDAPRFGLFEISAVIVQKKLRFSFTFNKYMRRQEMIRQWISVSKLSLETAIESMSQHSAESETNNFSLLGLTAGHREKCLNEILPRFGLSIMDLEDAYPCTGIQDGILLGRSRDSGYYSAAVSYEARCSNGSTDAQRLADAWQLVVRHHPALRTIFVESFSKADAMYDQLVLKDHKANLVRLSADSNADAMRLLESRRSDDFDDGRTPPHRFTIVETKCSTVFCMLEISHAIMDGESINVLFHDLAKAYHQHLHQPTPSFGEYVQHLRKMDLASGVQFWKNYLREVEPTSFPSLKDSNREIQRELRSIQFDSNSFNPQVVQDFCSENNITMANIFHTVWAITLSYYAGSEDVCFGYLTSGRDAPIEGIDNMVGPLINTLICRVKLHKHQTLKDILENVQQDYVDSFEHRLVPLSLVQNAVELHGSTLFNSVLSYRRVRSNKGTPQQENLAFIENGPYYDPTEYPIGINIEVSDNAVALSLEYWTDYISDAHAQNVASTFSHCLANILQHSSKALGELIRASPKHMQQILEWNKASPEIIHDCVHNAFLRQVRLQPDAPAICSHDGNFTYAELDSHSDSLAHYLVELGIGPEVYVPCCFDKSSFAVVAMMAVLKAGGACVALDANHPKEALKTKVLDTGASVVLTTAHRAELFLDYIPNVVCISKGLFNQIPICTKPVMSSASPANPAFVIFTSGSTGKPKGVVLEHRSIVTSMFAHGPKLDIKPGTRFLQFASYPFDVSLEEIFTTLLLGGCCCIPSEEQRMSNVVGAINELDVNFVDLTPTVASMIDPDTVPSVKVMAMGGEPLSKAVIEKWCRRVRLHAFYGPSEASISCTWKNLTNDTETEPNNIGRAIGSRAWIVHPEDVNLLQPIGCKGELLMEGPILARGYLGDRQKTEKSFICNPTWACGSGVSVRRFYRTGDLVSYGSNGDVKYHGRIDTQVKLNGQRIELGEIEHHMQLILPQGSQSAVELVTADGKKALAAFIELPTGPSKAEASPLLSMTEAFKVLVKTIEVSLSSNLPSYYVPKLFFPMAQMPMTTSGKLDRRNLRTLVNNLSGSQSVEYRLSENGGAPPSTPAELELARLWENILNLRPGTVGRESDFFQLGGDSATAMRLSMRARECGINLSVSAIFQSPTLSQMIAGSAPSPVTNGESKSSIPTLEPFALIPKNMRNRITKRIAKECEMDHSLIEDVYPCTKLQEGLIALSMQEPGAYVAQTVYKLPVGIDIEKFRKAWSVVFEAEPILRTRIVYTEEYGFLQAVFKQQIEWKSLENLESLSEASRHLPNREGGALCTFTLAGERTSPHFIWTAHHSIYDGWSIGLLLSKVENALKTNQTQRGEVVQYSHFINHLSDIDSGDSDSFWVSRLSGMDAPIFPLLPRPGYQAKASSSAAREVVASLPPKFNVTMASVIQSAWAALLSVYTSSAQVVLGLTVNGRDANVAGIEDMLGPTIATVPVLLDINRDWTVGEFLSEVQRLSAERMPYQHAGLQHIRQLNDETAAACGFQNMLMITSESSSETDSGLWNLQSTGAMGTNFFTYPLMVSCTISGEFIKIGAQYDSHVIAPWLVERILIQFEHTLHQLTSPAMQKSKVGDIPVLNGADRQQINAWNNKPLRTAQRTIHESIFSNKLGSSPALQSWDGRFTFSQLDSLTSKMARWLVYSGVKPGDFVPLCFERGALYVVALLAVLKSGAAFVPLDPEAPESRLRDLVRGVNANLMLCSPPQKSICEKLGITVLAADINMMENSTISSTTLPSVSPEQAAYCIYTSGSTGMPKGTVIQHYAFVSNATPCAEMLHIESGCRVLQFASYVFDSSLIEMLTPLIQGCYVFIPTGEDRLTNLMSYMQRNKIDWACLTPTVCQTMSPTSVPHLKTLVLAGEAMSPHHVSTWAPHVRLINGYGPTETSVAATINNKMTEATSPSNIGYAVGGRCWIVDKNNHNRLQPLGAIGEILVEGPTLARGYLNNPEKTAEVFITSPTWAREAQFQTDPYPRRFYKTGDLAKYNEDGSFFFIGRKDAQVKVRGQRLELGEVEQNLSLDSLVKHVIAAIPASGPCTKRLIAALCINNSSGTQGNNSLLVDFGRAKDVSSIRDRLCQRLPSYMVPTLWIVFHSLPLLPSGKLDRRRVVKFVEMMDDDTYQRISNAEEEETHNLDLSEVERQFQIIFGQVLNLPENKIGKTKSFLHLGGDSISAMQVQARCKSAGLGVTVQDIIRAKSIEELASKVSSVEETAPQDEATERSFGLSPIQRFFFDRVGNDFVRFNQSGPVLRMSRKFAHEDIARAATSITKAHSMLRARFDRMPDNTWSQRITNDVSGSFRFQSHRIQDSSQVASLTEVSQASLNVETGPLWSIDVFDVSYDNSQLLFLVAHHLVIDIVSWRVVLEDLESMLSGGQQNPQSLPFQIWSEKQEEQALKAFSTTVYPFKGCPTADLEYWGLSRSENLNGHVVSKTFELEPTYSLLLLGANDVLNTEALDIFIGSVLESFGRAFTDRTIPPVFNEGHGREPFSADQDLSRTIGWFTTLFPIYVALDAGEETDILSTIRWVRDFRSRVPQSGRPYFAYSMLRDATDKPFAAHFPMEIAFNYLGKMQQHDRKDALFRPVPEISTGQDVGDNVPRFSIFEISASISHGRVLFNFSYPKDIAHEQNIATWISECKLCLHEAVDGLIKCKPDADVAGFPLLPLAYRGDEKLSQRLLQLGMPSADVLEDVFPSSPMQQGILLSQIRNPEHYIFRTIFEVLPTPREKQVDISRLQSAWSAVVARHQALKMFFIESTAEQGLMEQCVLRDYQPRTSTLKCPDFRIPEIFQEHQRINCRDPVPPHALAIAETSSSRVFCMLEMSHAISDGSSMGVILDDLASAYDGKLLAKEPAARFSDYIKYFYSAERETDLAYWKNYLKDASPCLFPALTDGAKGPNSQQCLEITFDDLSGIKQFSKDNAVTVASLLQLAWAVLLRAYVGSEQVTFGYVASGRDIPLQGISEAVGCFVRMMICKVDFDDSMSVLDGLERVQNDFITAMDHQRCSLADVQHETQQQSLFNTAFTLQRQSEEHAAAEGLQFKVLDAMDPNEYAITLNADVSNSRIGVSMTYTTNIVCPAQATNIAETYQQIVSSIISSSPGQKLGDIEQLGESGLSQIRSWNMKLPERIDRCIHEVIAEQVQIRPSAQAVCAWDAEYSFSELDSMSTNLAWMLRSLGVGVEMPVPVCFEKSAYAVVAMLGILKAGGAFVPIDGSHPESRLQMLITELGARHVLCSPVYKEKLLAVATDAIVVDEQTLRRLPKKMKPPITEIGPSNLAYMIYTSGTTGVPKGTMIEHGSFCTSVKDHGPPLGISPEARVLQFASYTFDACVMEIFSTLMLGGCVCVPSSKQRMNDLPGAIRSMRVNWAVLTPSVANTIQPQDVPDLKTLMTAGEAQTPALVSTWAKHCRLINAYGPSETSIIAAFNIKSNETGQILNSDCATIGNAVGGRNWLVNSKDINKLTPIGSIGELVVEGRVVSRGYINNKEKTATSFFECPAWMNRKLLEPLKAQSDRMYRTGDLCRYNSDGSLVYIGRKDTQVKLNGQRIEMGEVEHHVESSLPADTLSAVDIVSTQNSSRKALCVFFCMASNMSVSSADSIANDSNLLLPFGGSHRSVAKTLESKLALLLPSYMIPTIFVPILRLPWNASGKLDRNLLKSLISGLSESELAPYRLADLSHKRQPTGRAEQALQRAWSAVLGHPPSAIGADDSWFRLGGDSVSSMRLVAAARHEGIIISVAGVMKNPTLSDMALTSQFLDTQPSPIQVEPFSLLRSDEPIEQILQECLYSYGVDEHAIQDAYPASPLQQAFITLSEKQPGAYVAQNGFRLTPSIDVPRLKRAWQQVIDDLSILRTRIVQTGTGNFVQVVLKTQEIEWISSESVESLSDYTLEIPSHNGGPLAAYAIVEEPSSGDRFFVWTIHHSTYDGWSMPLILNRVEEVYFKGSCQLPTPPFSSFIEYLGKTSPEQSRDFWKSRLAGVTPEHFPSPPRPDEESNFLEIDHSFPLSAIAGSNITPATLIRAAWALLLSAYSHSEDVIFGETLSGRDIPVENITDLVGPILTTVPMRVQIDRNQSISDFLLSIVQDTLSTIDHQHYGLSQIKRIDEYCSTACDFQNLLVIQTGEDQGQSKLWTPHISEGSSSTFFTYPLVLECTAGSSAVNVVAHYNSNVISSFQIQRMLWQLETILGQLSDVQAAGTKLKDLNTVSVKDFESIREWNAAEPLLVDDTLNSVFRRQVSRRPKAIAVSAHDGEFTYAELSNEASKVANYLRRLGVGPGTYVPVCLEKSKWMMVAILGVILAGGAYVPLDPKHPISRHQEIAEDVQASVVLCSAQYRNLYSGLPEITLFEVGENTISNLPSLYRRSTSPYTLKPSPNDPVYVIYTSGSTGRPKGVVIEHRSFCSSAQAMCQAFHISNDTRAFHFASLVFDASVMETLTPLSCGATICIPSDADKLNDVSHTMNNFQVTWAFLTTSVANIITSPSSVPTLETLVVGGEAMTAETVAKWTSGKVCLINAYGPTEATVSCNGNIDVAKKRDPLNIGHAFASCRLWIVDPKDPNKLSPIGASGELAIEGPILAREYLNDSEKTKAAFFSTPTWIERMTESTLDDPRVYLTGDLVRYSQDGSLIYISRKDNQVKVNGQRLEIGEIEAHLLNACDGHDALVVFPKQGMCKKRLVAIVSSASSKEASDLGPTAPCEVASGRASSDLEPILSSARKALSAKLPPYMVPSVWISLKAIPRMFSGKLDRKKVLGWAEQMSKETYRNAMGIGNRTSTKDLVSGTALILRQILSRVLNISEESIDISQSFTSMGGDSITAMAMMARCRKEKITLNMHQILHCKSIEELSQSIGMVSESSKTETAENHGPFALSPIQRLYFHLNPEQVEGGHFNQSFTLKLARKIDAKTIEEAIKKIVSQHPMLRARFIKVSNLWHQRTEKKVDSTFHFQSHRVGCISDIADAISRSHARLNISNGPAFSVELFNVADGTQVLFMAAHHLVVDMVSWRIILQDLEEWIQVGSLLSERPLLFSAWRELQSDQASKPRVLPSFEIAPTDLGFWGMSGKSNTYADTECDDFVVNKTISGYALDTQTALKTEPVDLFIAAILHSFSRTFVTRETPTVYNESHGREPLSDVDPSRTVGWFTSLCPISIPISEEQDDVIETLKRVKDVRRKMSDNGRDHFASQLLVDPSNFEREFPVEIVFNYLGKMQQLERNESLLQPLEFDDPRDQSKVSDVGPNATRIALFEISATVNNGLIHFSFVYNRNMQRQKGIHRWLVEFERTFEELAMSLKNLSIPEATLADFPLLPLESYDRLEKLMQKTLPAAGIPSLDNIEDIYPCVPMQEGMLLAQAKDSKAYLFHVLFEMKFKRDNRMIPVDPQKLADAWQKVTDRHPALRTIFINSVCRGGVFDQVVLKKLPCTTEIRRKAQFDPSALLECGMPNIKPAPPHQLTILSTQDRRVFVKLEMNHAVIDGTSHSILLQDLAAAYEDQLPNEFGPLYSNYVRYIRTEASKDGVAYWMQYLQGIRPCCVPVLKKDRNTVRKQGTLLVDFDEYSKLLDICKADKVTLSSMLQGIWARVLALYTNSDDVAFGYVASGRDVPVEGIQDAVGAFINMLVCRVQFKPGADMRKVFRKVQSDFIDALPHQHTSLARVQHDLGLSGESLFNTAISIQNHPEEEKAERSGLLFEQIEGYDPSEFALTVNIETAPNCEGVLLRYWTDVVSDANAARLGGMMAQIMKETLDLGTSPHIPNARGTVAEEPVISPQPLLSQLERLVDMSAAQQGNSMDLSHMIQSIVDRAVQNAVKTALQGQPTQSVNSSTIIEDHVFDATAIDSARQGSVKVTQTKVVNGYTYPHTGGAHSDVAEIVKQAADIPDPGTALSDCGAQLDCDRQKLLSLWSEALDLSEDSIEPSDSFFKLGGDSIAAMKLVGAAREEGLTLTVGDVFQNPIFTDMARVCISPEDTHAVKTITRADARVDVVPGAATPATSVTTLTGDGTILSPASKFTPTFKAIQRQSQVSSLESEEEDWKHDWPASSKRAPVDLKTPTPKDSLIARRQSMREDIYRAFSLLKKTNAQKSVDSFLQESIVPKVQVFRGGIADVLPTTDFQSLAITGALLESRWMLNYFYLDGEGDLDLRSLRKSAFRIVHAFDILRTVFVPYGDQFLQVVLRKLQPEFIVQETDKDLDDFTNQLHQRDRLYGPRLGESFIQFRVAKKTGTKRHRIFIRISHAQYDGVCMPMILEALQEGYQGLPIPSTPSFSNYVRDAAGRVTNDHYDYWTDLLQGSKMTEIVKHRQPNFNTSDRETITLRNTIYVDVNCFADSNITPASFIKAAWAFVLAKITATSDVVFGHVISGRNSNVRGISSIVGPCLNTVPVRVAFESHWTVLDLCRFIQSQQIDNMPYETLGSREIIKRCTDWPDWTNFSTVVQHQSVKIDEKIKLGDNFYKVGAIGSQLDTADMAILSTPKRDGSLELRLSFSSDSAISPEFAESVLQMLCQTLFSFSGNLHYKLPTPSEISAMANWTLDSPISRTKKDKDLAMNAELHGLNRGQVLALSDMLRSAWQRVLRHDKFQPVLPELHSSFFELGGDVIGLAQVASLLDQEGIKIRVEDLIEHHVMIDQLALIGLRVAEEAQEKLSAEIDSTPWLQLPPEPPRKMSMPRLIKSMAFGRKVGKKDT